MNNKQVKNILLGMDSNVGLPYSENNDVVIHNNQIISDPINYTFEKMRDNDLYLEKSLIKQSNFVAGPDTLTEENLKNQTEDGLKFIDGIIDNQENNISVLQKNVKPIQDTLYNSWSIPANYFFQVNGTVYSSTESGIIEKTQYTGKENEDTWVKANSLKKITELYSSYTQVLYDDNNLNITLGDNYLYKLYGNNSTLQINSSPFWLLEEVDDEKRRELFSPTNDKDVDDKYWLDTIPNKVIEEMLSTDNKIIMNVSDYPSKGKNEKYCYPVFINASTIEPNIISVYTYSASFYNTKSESFALYYNKIDVKKFAKVGSGNEDPIVTAIDTTNYGINQGELFIAVLDPDDESKISKVYKLKENYNLQFSPTNTWKFEKVKSVLDGSTFNGRYNNSEDDVYLVFSKIISLENGNKLLCSNYGLYIYDAKLDYIYKNQCLTNEHIVDVKMIIHQKTSKSEPYTEYYIFTKNNVLKTTDFITSEKVLSFDENIEIECAYIKDSFEIYIGTNHGIYCTYYAYDLENNYVIHKLFDVNQVIGEVYNEKVKEHIEEYHGEDSVISKINKNIMTTDMSRLPEDWEKNNEFTEDTPLIAKNDYVVSCDLDNALNHVTGQFSNFTQSSDENGEYGWGDIGGIDCICKYFKSGVTELYVYVPTTNTYYIPHIDGTPGCSNSGISFNRKNNSNVPLDGSLEKASTHFRIFLDNSYFKINELLGIQVNGNSLPLEIYKDTDHIEDGAESVFHSFIEPTICKTVPLGITYSNEYGRRTLGYLNDEGKYVFDFWCFGSDAQAIKIEFTKELNYFIEFNANGAEFGRMDTMVGVIGSYLKLPKNKYTRNGCVFKGWSYKQRTSTDAVNPSEIDFIDEDSLIAPTYRNGEIITVYAVWEAYQFDRKIDNTFILNVPSYDTKVVVDSGELANGYGTSMIRWNDYSDTFADINVKTPSLTSDSKAKFASGLTPTGEEDIHINFGYDYEPKDEKEEENK